jgi:glycosyltransferase involved in cell wall biosynthesis
VKILQISLHDKFGGAQIVANRLHKSYSKLGLDSHLAVGHKFRNEAGVQQINTSQVLLRFENRIAPHLERRLGWQFIFYPSSFLLAQKPYFRHADILHLHNTHYDYFTHLALPYLTSRKPAIWTLHDMWALTGHCAHSFDCMRWKTGCGSCPNLDTYPRLRKDTTAFLWRMKNYLYHKTNIKIVTPSIWLKKLVEQSFLSKNEILCIPNGIDLNIFKSVNKAEVRRGLGIPDNAHVLAFTVPDQSDAYRSYDFLVNGLRNLLDPSYVFLSIGKRHLPADLYERFSIFNVGFLEDEKDLANVLSASDVYIQPSLAESFSLSTVEALACGVPVIGSNVGGIPEIIRAPLCGLIVPPMDSVALAQAVHLVMSHDELRLNMSYEARRTVEKEYGLPLQVERYLSLYQRTIDERHNSYKFQKSHNN